MQIGEPLDGIGQCLLVEVGVLRPYALSDGAVGGGRKRELVHGFTS